MLNTSASMLPLNTFNTPRDLLRYAISCFNQAKLCFGHGTQDAFDEAAYLLLHTLHLPLDKLEPFLDARLLEGEIQAVLDIIHRRVNERIPAAYLTGESWLQGYRFSVDPRVIIPRSLLGELLKEQLSPWIEDPFQVRNMLDVCTGSACLAIIAADMFPSAQVDAVDISAEALEVARHNVTTYDLHNRVTLLQSDLFTQLPQKKYDVILSNPPYVNDASMARLPQEYRHEPQLALAGGKDGMHLVRELLQQAPSYLNVDGYLIVEIGHERAFVEAAFPELSLTWLTTSAGDDAVFLLRREHLIAT